eukprot:scaffold73_cov337-Pavlova_lutheri.AAC.75
MDLLSQAPSPSAPVAHASRDHLVFDRGFGLVLSGIGSLGVDRVGAISIATIRSTPSDVARAAMASQGMPSMMVRGAGRSGKPRGGSTEAMVERRRVGVGVDGRTWVMES